MSSDSSDEENLAMLREAIDFSRINDSMFQLEATKEKAPTVSTKTRPPSLRRSQDEDEQYDKALRVTPAFRSHVARRLDRILEARLDVVPVDQAVGRIEKKERGGVRLLRDSKRFVQIEDLKSADADRSTAKRKFIRSNRKRGETDCENDEAKVKSVVVSSEDVLSKKDVKFWSNRSKAAVFHYRRTKTGLISYDPNT